VPTPNWTTEFKSSYRGISELEAYLGFKVGASENLTSTYPVFIPRRLARKIKMQGPLGILAKEFLPADAELALAESGSEDPIGDQRFLKAPQLIHRYPTRALFTPTTICPVLCRYCFRKNELNAQEDIFKPEFDKTLSYLRDHPEISEIIFTGGDPFTLSDEKILFYLEAFKKIPTIKDVRFHTRYPVVLPERIDDGLMTLLKTAQNMFRTVSVAIHANHTDEFDAEAEAAVSRLHQTGVQLLSQTVLLKGINDNRESLLNLFNLFLRLKIRPYYLHHPDQVKGGMHFYLSLETGRTLYHSLRQELPGWAIPQYIIDLPGGEGKVPAHNSESHTFSGHLITLKGERIFLQEPII
jgi:lysine 2,3-aminomutase